MKTDSSQDEKAKEKADADKEKIEVLPVHKIAEQVLFGDDNDNN